MLHSLVLSLFYLYPFSTANAADPPTTDISNCLPTPDWWNCSLSIGITNDTPDQYTIKPTMATATLWNNKCESISTTNLIGDYAILDNTNASALTNTLQGPDPQADWRVTLKIALPTAGEEVCTNITVGGDLTFLPPSYAFRGCGSLMPISKGCNAQRYQKTYRVAGLGFAEAACGLTPGLAVIESRDRWGNMLFRTKEIIAAGKQMVADQACVCVTGGTCKLGEKGGFCCRCPIPCKSRYFY